MLQGRDSITPGVVPLNCYCFGVLHSHYVGFLCSLSLNCAFDVNRMGCFDSAWRWNGLPPQTAASFCSSTEAATCGKSKLSLMQSRLGEEEGGMHFYKAGRKQRTTSAILLKQRTIISAVTLMSLWSLIYVTARRRDRHQRLRLVAFADTLIFQRPQQLLFSSA